jgi:NADH dehydrogenase
MGHAIAISGANGWLGLHLVRAARAAGLDARALVRSDEGRRAVEAAGGQAVVAADLDPASLGVAIGGCCALVHLAGISAERQGATYEAANVEGMRKVISAARGAGVPRIVFLSGLGVARYGITRRVTNGYFLAKLAAEVELFRSGLEALVFRPSYVVGPEDELIPAVLAEMGNGEVEVIGQGAYRLQPVALGDACAAVLAGSTTALRRHTVVDLVGPEALTYRAFVERAGEIAGAMGRADRFVLRDVSVDEADRQAAAGGYRGLWPDELDVLLCDETGDKAALEALLGRPLTPLDDTLRLAIEGSRARSGAAFRR